MMNTNTLEKELTGYPSIDKPWLKYYDVDQINKTELPNIYNNMWVILSSYDG